MPRNPDSPADSSVLTTERRRAVVQKSPHSCSAPGGRRAPQGSQLFLHFLAQSTRQARPCSKVAGGRRWSEGKERQAKPGEARRAAGGRAAWARTGQDSPPGGWQVTPQARTGPEVDAGAQGAGSADGEQVPGLRQPHPGPNTGPGARAGDQRQGPRQVRPLRPV